MLREKLAWPRRKSSVIKKWTDSPKTHSGGLITKGIKSDAE